MGWSYVQSIGRGPIRMAIEHNGAMLVVSGNEVYKVTDQDVTLCGTINTTTGNVGMASNGVHLAIIDGQDGWLWDDTTFAKVADLPTP